MSEVIIDGVRYVPAREIAGGIDDLKEALLDVFWGSGYRGTDPAQAEDGLYITVYDSAGEGGVPFSEFIDGLIDTLAKRAPQG